MSTAASRSIAAWVIGAQAMIKALLGALVEPIAQLCQAE
jgi:L-rhamnose isomerase